MFECSGDITCSKCHKEILPGEARVEMVLCRECEKGSGEEELAGYIRDWVVLNRDYMLSTGEWANCLAKYIRRRMDKI